MKFRIIFSITLICDINSDRGRVALIFGESVQPLLPRKNTFTLAWVNSACMPEKDWYTNRYARYWGAFMLNPDPMNCYIKRIYCD
jgi:hypothetical protein